MDGGPDSVQQFLDDLRTLKERSSLTFKQMATRGLVSHSTLHAAIAKGQTQLPSANTVEAFVRATTPESERQVAVQDWLGRRAALLATVRGINASPSSESKSEPQQRRWPWLAGAIAAVLLIFVAGAVVGRATAPLTSGFTSNPGSATDSSGAAGPSVSLVRAKVANTANLGVFAYAEPTNKSTRVASLMEGEQVFVVCLRLNGEAITDDGLKMTRTVWALLGTGTWVPDLYLDLDKSWSPPNPPPAPLFAC